MFLSRHRNKYFYIYTKDVNGKRIKFSTGKTNKSEALKVLIEYSNKCNDAGNNRIPIELSAFINEYLKYSQIYHAINTTRTCKSVLSELIRVEGDLRLYEIDSHIIDHFLSTKVNVRSAHTMLRYYRTLRSIFEQAKKWKYVQENPMLQIPRPKTPSIELKYFTKEAFSKLMNIIPSSSVIKPMAYFGINTGCRLSEIINAEWRNIDFERKIYTVTSNEKFQTKNKRCRVIPLNHNLFNLLLKMKQGDRFMNYIFSKSDGSKYTMEYVSRKFGRYCRKIGICDLSFHSLRKSFGCWLLMSDVPIFTISKLLGHSSIAVTTEHYATLYTDQLHDVVNKLTIGD